jgi:hypothetical protein
MKHITDYYKQKILKEWILDDTQDTPYNIPQVPYRPTEIPLNTNYVPAVRPGSGIRPQKYVPWQPFVDPNALIHTPTVVVPKRKKK